MKRIVYAALAATCLSLPAQAASVADRFSSFFVMGDSLSDNGSIIPQANWLGATGGAPFFDRPDLPGPNPLGVPIEEGGTFTSGEVWSQPITNAFLLSGKLALNFANGGATADTAPGPVGLDLAAQTGAVATYIGGGLGGARPLVAAWFGANDIFRATDAAGGPTGTDFSGVFAAAEDAADNIVTALGTLQTLGVMDFIVPNLPNLGLTPSSRLAEAFAASISNAAYIGLAEAATDAFNTTLASGLTTLALNGANIYTVDVDALLTDAVNNPGAYGYNNVTQGCVTVSCTNVSEFLFIDGVHPTAGAHSLIGGEATAAVVPLPAGVWLLLGGIGMLTLRRRAAA